ncbi:hypothetical protein Hypma_014825 [Hypsizygus marmoreus]|uniref:DUF6534 domain-containing protein n=1 Tax=Hypsizygus marmoreus TaxID=39966 RepID=A0A369KA99_HYPMA|nr:hypothetical protein Hypma_014825 [Hypsizygus marmoreus]
MATPHASINLDSKIGAAFLGNLIAGIFYGITCVQTYIYFKRNDKDSTSFRLLIFFLWLLDTLHLALVTHGIYYYLISNYGNLPALASPTWSLLAQVYVTCISDLIIRGVFGRRVWLMAGKSKIIVTGIQRDLVRILPPSSPMPNIVLTESITFATRAYAGGTFAKFSQISYLLYIALGSGVVADFLIAGSLCRSLWKSRTGFRKTDTLVNVLMMYAINTSLLTTICSGACFITYTIWPNEFTFIGIYFSLSKLFLNSLLATLNSRESLSEKINGVSDISMSDMSHRRHFSSMVSGTRSGPSVLVSINHEVVDDYEQGRTEKDGERIGNIP